MAVREFWFWEGPEIAFEGGFRRLVEFANRAALRKNEKAPPQGFGPCYLLPH